jgi:hypothetical protein
MENIIIPTVSQKNATQAHKLAIVVRLEKLPQVCQAVALKPGYYGWLGPTCETMRERIDQRMRDPNNDIHEGCDIALPSSAEQQRYLKSY